MDDNSRDDRSERYDENYFRKHEDAAFRSAELVAPIVVKLTEPKVVVDVGCGSGQWVRAFLSNGAERVYAYDAFSDPAAILKDSRVKFKTIDLERDKLDCPKADLVCCLEMAEHIETSSSGNLVRELCDASDLVAFSAALPGQGGTGHVNEQWLSYWVNLFEQNDFVCYDVIRPLIWSESEVSWWYRQNLVLFTRASTPVDSVLQEKQLPSFLGANIIHPELYQLKCKNSWFLQQTDSE